MQEKMISYFIYFTIISYCTYLCSGLGFVDQLDDSYGKLFIGHHKSSNFNKYGGSSSSLRIAKDIFLTGDHGGDSNLEHVRQKRGASKEKVKINNSKTDPGHQPIISKFEMNDSNQQVMVDWAGEGSKVIICVTKNHSQTVNSTTKVYISYDYGTTFQDKTSLFFLKNKTLGLIFKFYKNEKFTDRFIFADTFYNYLYVTMDYGHTILNRELKFTPNEVSSHPSDALTIVILDTKDKMRRLWVTTDFGETWSLLSSYVKSYYWSEKTSPISLYVEREEPGNASVVLAYQKFDDIEFEPKIVITHVRDFKAEDDFLFAVKDSKNPEGKELVVSSVEMWISYKNGPFLKAEFPNKLRHEHYYVADISDGQILVCVSHGGISSNLYVSSAPTGVDKNIRFSLSLERILYFNPGKNFNDTWLSEVADEVFADLYVVKGIRGVIIASQLFENYTKMSSVLNPIHLTSLISFNQGGTWMPIQPPKKDYNGRVLSCKIADGCSLHISQEFSSLFPGTLSLPILSTASSPGLIISSGTLGASLKGHPAVYMSSDAGLEWYQILQGNYLYSLGDYGGIILAVKHYRSYEETNQLLYSMDEGETWHYHTFYKEKLKVYGLMTEPGENSTVFTLFGSRPERHLWIIVKINMNPVFKYQCTPNDYKTWVPLDDFRGGHCLLGRKEMFKRRIPYSNCFSGVNYDVPKTLENCPCTREDYECDFGFKILKSQLASHMDQHMFKSASIATKYIPFQQEMDAESNICVMDEEDFSNPFDVPKLCSSGKFYNRTQGYRKVPGDSCKGGGEIYEPLLTPCPVNEDSEFLLISSRNEILHYNLLKPEDGLTKLPIHDLKAAIAIDFHLKNNCIYWFDASTAPKQIMRQCFNGKMQSEVLVDTNLNNVEGLAIDWVSDNLYFVDAGLKSVQAVHITSEGAGLMRRTLLNETQLDLPRGIALHPVRGLMFITDWSQSNPMVASAHLDGTNLKKLFGTDIVGWPNGITIDFQTERIYWADALFDYIASADLDGSNMHKVISGNSNISQPFAVGVYKSLLFWDDWVLFHVFQADKEHGWGVTPLSNKTIEGLVDLKVFGHWTQTGSNMCSMLEKQTKCDFLCMGRPDNGYSCMCPDWMKISSTKNNIEECFCPDMSKPDGNACLAVNNTCPHDLFKCDNSHCIPKQFECDGDNDCGDNSDESRCKSCSEYMWQCKNGHCISTSWKCDVDDDCGDGSDEEGCSYQKCSLNQFSCHNKRCIDKKWRCDLQDDCKDGSDEANCTHHINPDNDGTCRLNQFQCESSKSCVPMTWRCDDEYDCDDESDEKNCTDHTCVPWQFQCSNRRCIYKTWVCDGQSDCADGSDEKNCSSHSTLSPIPFPIEPLFPFPSSTNGSCAEHEFHCSNGSCIPFWWRCDKVNDCTDGGDEVGCGEFPHLSTTTSSSGIQFKCQESQMECKDGDCIWDAWVCDGEKDCSSGEDEDNCTAVVKCKSNQFHCLKSEGCIEHTQFCDGNIDCADGSDEIDCKPNNIVPPHIPNDHCTEDYFSCDGGACMSIDKKCDGNMDCIDMSDERGCHNSHKFIKISNLRKMTQTTTSLTFGWDLHPLTENGTIDFKPSCIVKEAIGNKNAWRNATWITNDTYTFHGLIPFTSYILKVYLRHNKTNTEYTPNKVIIMKTLVDVPSPPVDINIVQVGSELQVNWQPPYHPNGPIQSYHIYITPPEQPLHFIVEQPSTQYSFLPSQEQKVISLWMTVTNLRYTSNHSEIVSFTPSTIDKPVSGLKVKVSKNISSVTLTWNSLEGVAGYEVSYAYPENEFMGSRMQINVSKAEFYLNNLSPGLTYIFKVRGFNGAIVGPSRSIDVSMPGEKLPPLTNVNNYVSKYPGTSVNMTWNEPEYSQHHTWQYQIVYGRTMAELKKRVNVLTTTETFITIHHLDACQIYIVALMLCGPIGVGPAKQIQVRTLNDPRSPPTNVAVNTDGKMLKISWQSPCPVIKRFSEDLRYLLTVKETSLEQTSYFNIPSSSKSSTQKYWVKMHYGGHYEVSVQTLMNGSRSSIPITTTGPPIPPPYELTYSPSDGSFFWRNRKSIPMELIKQNYSYVLYLVRISKDNSSYMELSEGVLAPPHKSNLMSPGQVYLASIAFRDSEGYLSIPSQQIRVEKPIGDSLVLPQNSIVGVSISVMVVLMILVALIVVLAVRHKRLAGAFAAFANTRYDRSMGTTLITTDHNLDEDDDSPMIRGFSDDEPLVIA